MVDENGQPKEKKEPEVVELVTVVTKGKLHEVLGPACVKCGIRHGEFGISCVRCDKHEFTLRALDGLVVAVCTGCDLAIGISVAGQIPDRPCETIPAPH